MNQPDQSHLQQFSTLEKSDELDLFAFVKIIFGFWWFVGPMALIGAAAGLWFAYQIPPTYRAQARFEIYRNRMLYINPSQQLREERKPSWNYDPTNYHIVRMQDLHDKVQSRLKSKWPQEITANVKIDSVENEGIMDIKVDSLDKQYALEFLEELISLYKEKLKDESVNIHANTQLLLQKEKEEQEKKIVEMREKITDFELKNNLGFEKRKLESDQKHLVEIDARFRDIKAQRSILESQIKFLENANAATLRDALDLATHDPKAPNRQSNWADTSDWRENESKILRLKAEYEAMKKVYLPGHPKMQELQEKINNAKRELTISAQLTAKRLESRLSALTSLEKALKDERDEINKKLAVSKVENAKYENMKAQLSRLNQNYEKVYTRYIESSTTIQNKYYTSLAQKPHKLEKPVAPNKMKFLALGTLGMGSLSSILVLLYFFSRLRLHNFEELEKTLGIQCLVAIPGIPQKYLKKGPTFLSELSKTSPISEVYRSLKTSVEFSSEKSQYILITSPEPGEGKSFTSLNLAISYSWSQKKVLLIDGDFRHLSLRDAFPEASKEGLLDYLTNDDATDIDSFINKDVIPHLDYLPGGTDAEHASELIGSEKYRTLLEKLRTEYDTIIMDTAPVNRVVDTVHLSSFADVTIIIAKLGKTTPESLRFAYGRLSKSNVIGYVLNNISSASKRYSSYAGGYYGNYHGKDYYS